MNGVRHREEHANTLLALFLRGMGIDAKAETVNRADRAMPDITIKTFNLIIVAEAKYDDCAGAEASADDRLDSRHPPDMICALSYSPDFKGDFVRAVEDRAPLHFAVKRSDTGKGDWEGRWRIGTVDDFVQMLRRPDAAALMPHNEVAVAVARVKQALKDFADRFRGRPGVRERIADLLQASLPVAGKAREEAAGQSLHLAGVILIGAFLFQSALSAKNRRVKNPRDFESDNVFISDIEDHWRFILNEINYAAIFRIAAALLKKGDVPKAAAVRLMRTARDISPIARDGVDVMGVMYHEILAELAKPLGAYYTTIPAATLLSALALSPRRWKGTDWAEEKTVRDFRIVDFACGTGTLLAAACGQVRDNAARAYAVRSLRAKQIPYDGRKILSQTQCALLEDVVWGYDVLDTAAHLTATTLGLMSPEVDFRKSHIYRAAVGENEIGAGLAGSLQLLDDRQVTRGLFDSDINPEARIAHAETGDEKSAPQPAADLCIMNPPFVVGRKNAPSYSFLPPSHAERVRDKMNALARRHKFSNAGLGPAFVALGEKYLKEGGLMAFVMTATIASGRGAAWAGARRRIEQTCDLEYLITGSQFSFNTNKQECMFVARKRKNGDNPKTHALFCMLFGDLTDGNIAHAVAQEIMAADKSGEEWGELRIAERTVGEFARLRYRGRETWDGIAFTNLRLTAAMDALAESGTMQPYSDGDCAIPLRPLRKQAAFGSARLQRYTNSPEIKEDARRYLAFSKTATRYPGYYVAHYQRRTGIGQKDLSRLADEPNCHFLPLPKCDAWAKKYFSWGGRILVNLSFGFNSSRRLAVLLSAPVQGANYQPVRLHNDSDARAKAMTLWLNSSPAVLMMAAYSVVCGGAKVMLSQKAIGDMPVLNLDALSAAQLRSIARAFDKIAGMDFLPIPRMAECPARKAADDALVNALKLDGFDFAALRDALATEPIITGK